MWMKKRAEKAPIEALSHPLICVSKLVQRDRKQKALREPFSREEKVLSRIQEEVTRRRLYYRAFVQNRDR